MNRFRELKMYETLNSVANIYQETKNIPITQHTLEQPRAWEPGIFGAIQERVYSVVSSVRASLFS